MLGGEGAGVCVFRGGVTLFQGNFRDGYIQEKIYIQFSSRASHFLRVPAQISTVRLSCLSLSALDNGVTEGHMYSAPAVNHV